MKSVKIVEDNLEYLQGLYNDLDRQMHVLLLNNPRKKPIQGKKKI